MMQGGHVMHGRAPGPDLVGAMGALVPGRYVAWPVEL